MTSRNRPGSLLLFGASGAIGSEVTAFFQNEGWRVVCVTRGNAPPKFTTWNPLDRDDTGAEVLAQGPFDAVCWAQGDNANDSITSFDPAVHTAMYQANVMVILHSLHGLLNAGALAPGARLCVISSIWQESARQTKLSYSITKSALRGLVLSVANDLGQYGYLINAILPGVIDTPMTRKNLTAAQIDAVVGGTQFKRLVTLCDVAAAVYSLCSFFNTGVTGQFIKVDLGYTDVRII